MHKNQYTIVNSDGNLPNVQLYLDMINLDKIQNVEVKKNVNKLKKKIASPNTHTKFVSFSL